MVQPGFGNGLDTPRTNVGDATWLSRQPDFDISQEASFQSPGKDNNLLSQLRDGRSGGISLRTPRGRNPLGDRRNLPAGIGGAEFTPMLKSATRNRARRPFGKENGAAVPNTPALDKIEEDMTPIPNGDMSMYSRNASYAEHTPLPHVDTSSAASTPLVLPPRRGEGKGPLQDGNQLSLREQEDVIDRIEKENFGLKLKIHFLEEALRKAGPEFSQEAMKENTELKVDKLTMQRDLQKYKKHLTTAEKDLETYRQQMLQLQERAKKKYADEKHLAEIERLSRALEDKEAEVDNLQRQLDQESGPSAEVDKLRDEIEDLEANVREKDNRIGEYEDEIDELRTKLDTKNEAAGEHDEEVEELRGQLEESEEKAKHAQRRVLELEQDAGASEELEEAKETIEDLESNIRRLEDQVEDLRDRADDATTAKEKAESNLEELQDEMANKSVVTKGLTRQKEERLVRLQQELEQSDEKFATLEKQLSRAAHDNQELKNKIQESRNKKTLSDQERQSLLDNAEELKKELQTRLDEKSMLQTRNDALSSESSSLQRDVARLQKSVEELEQSLSEERDHAMTIESSLRDQFKDDIDRLNSEVSDLQAEVRERDNLYDNDSEKWDADRQTLESERDRAEQKAAGLERTIAKLREAEGNLSDKETRLQEALQSETERHRSEQTSLNRQIEELQSSLETKQTALNEVRSELSDTQVELRQAQVDYQSQVDKVEALEDEVEVLQTTLDEETVHSRQELEAAQRESSTLKQQLESLRRTADSAQGSASSSREQEFQMNASIERLRKQLEDSNAQVARISKEKQTLGDQFKSLESEIRSLRTSLIEVKAERDEADSELKRLQSSGEDNLRTDRERLDLRTAKMKLDNEVRRLKDENHALTEQRRLLEQSLEDEIDKATEEEERLQQEILQLQTKLRNSSAGEVQESSSSRRNIRELERRIQDYEQQLAGVGNASHAPEGNSELSIIRRDLSAARQKEREFAERESAHKDVVKSLKRQITDLERKAHDAEMSRLITSPNSSNASARPEMSQLRSQLSSAHQTIHDLKIKARDSDRKASQVERDFQARLDALEDQKLSWEQALEDAQRDADEAAVLHDKAVRRLHQKLEKSERERRSAAPSNRDVDGQALGRRDLQDVLRKARAETEALEHDVLQQQETIDSLEAAESSLRRKLERARSERAAYRFTAEKLQKDIKGLKAAAAASGAAKGGADGGDEQRVIRFAGQEQAFRDADSAIDTVIRAAEGAEERHAKELKGMSMQMEWMQARWERELSMRADAAYAKKFLQLELDLANACNKAQLRELEQIRTEVLGSRRELPPLPSNANKAASSSAAGGSSHPKLKTVAIMARFVARTRISARAWQKHEATRKKLADRVEEMRKTKRQRGLKVVRSDEGVEA